MTATTTLRVHPIRPEVLAGFRASGRDGLDRPITPHRADGGEPLRCCLRRAGSDESIAVISYSPTPVAGPWQEYGPVFVHVDDCGGRDVTDELPDGLRTGPRVLRSYAHDGTLNYDAIGVVDEGEDIEPVLRELLGRADVAEVHVRALREQCFTYAVRIG